MTRPFPFAAIVGQEEMKNALLMAAVEPALGGVLVLGDRGTAKSTAVRALAALLPSIETRGECPYNCPPDNPVDICPVCSSPKPPKKVKKPTPVIDLPLGATDDRVVGALDLEKALINGEKAFEPGLLAKAHRGFLYIDEVNLLEDYLVDLLLDVAASGLNIVEREGLSVRHPARFILIGSGNPEEGELRPQLLDRFGLSVEVTSPKDIKERIEVIRRRDAYDHDPDAFMEKWKAKDARIRSKISKAKKVLPEVETPDEVLEIAATLCLGLGVDGLRGELTLIRAGRARAALAGRRKTTPEDIRAIATTALRHRLRRDPLDEAGSTVRVERIVREVFDGEAANA
ncbi:magnesium chelatase subunit I [Rhodobium orientis]|uniref:Mg-protoporphyrin IX chelatase n=1 Tax=Rhodobium orientis TaxID=34017 RepID=A0A327JQX3_9HYPH|nr:magnesium chelatase ATPase subunit I [Rhodobium orientis]MBB4303295.1 magnesium chelatase subunit I [Rhodobium orientis]MBK5951608.1 magnesium chelatase ATPase subunit I [Rhodobium orientis]RAI27814.1 magnesium chelatase ATPase subunit I [Rhodobium orientis]